MWICRRNMKKFFSSLGVGLGFLLSVFCHFCVTISSSILITFISLDTSITCEMVNQSAPHCQPETSKDRWERERERCSRVHWLAAEAKFPSSKLMLTPWGTHMHSNNICTQTGEWYSDKVFTCLIFTYVTNFHRFTHTPSQFPLKIHSYWPDWVRLFHLWFYLFISFFPPGSIFIPRWYSNCWWNPCDHVYSILGCF